MPGASGRVLVVDDNKVIRQLIRVNLELEGIEVVTAADGAECLDLVHQVRPDVITLDVVMPRLDGLRTVARLRSDPRTRSLPLAIVSACTQYEVEAGLDVGVDAFLAKPFEPVELVRLVRQLMEMGGRVGRGAERSGVRDTPAAYGQGVHGGVGEAPGIDTPSIDTNANANANAAAAGDAERVTDPETHPERVEQAGRTAPAG